MNVPIDTLVRSGRDAALRGRHEAAAELLGSALAQREDNAVRLALADAFLATGRWDALDEVLAKGRTLYPDEADYPAKAAVALIRRGRIMAARTGLEEAIAVHGATPALMRLLSTAMLNFGDTRVAAEILSASLGGPTPDAALISPLLYLHTYDETLDLPGLRRRQQAFAGAFPSPPPRAFPPWDGARPLRIGYVSGAFRRHSAVNVFMPVILGHDRTRTHITLYSTGPQRDAVSMKLRFGVDAWRSITELPAAEAAQMIVDDGIDVLVDLMGHTAGGRLDVFALRPAPIQVSAWGYLSGPGTPGIDYLLSDTTLITPDERARIADRIIDTPCPTIMEPAPLACEDPPDNGSRVKIGVFSRSEKISRTSAALWDGVLATRPQAQLVLKGHYFGDPAVAAHFAGYFPQAAPGQVVFQESERMDEYRHALSRLDLAFDPYPYSGGIVTLDALAQGTPVLTLPGKLPSSRTTASILSHWELDELIAANEADFTARALALIDHRAERLRLRDRALAQRGRFDNAYFQKTVRDFEDAVMALRRQD